MVARRANVETIEVHQSPGVPRSAERALPNRRVRPATKLEARQILNRRSLHELGITGREFLKRLDKGDYSTIADQSKRNRMNRVKMVIPFVRPTKG